MKILELPLIIKVLLLVLRGTSVTPLCVQSLAVTVTEAVWFLTSNLPFYDVVYLGGQQHLRAGRWISKYQNRSRENLVKRHLSDISTPIPFSPPKVTDNEMGPERNLLWFGITL